MEASPAGSSSVSSYFQGLDKSARERYQAKLARLGGLQDSYLGLGQGLSEENWQNWPKIEYPDIYNFLIEFPSLYTGESLKAYKSLDAYNYYINGWIEKATVFKVLNCPSTYLAIGSVKHSQSLSATPAKPWVGVKAVCPLYMYVWLGLLPQGNQFYDTWSV